MGVESIGSNFMKKIAIFAVLAAACAMPAAAAGNAHSGATLGDCISDGFYGNEPNIEPFAPGGPADQEPGTIGGTVVPSQSPGPFVNNPADPDNPTRGSSLGDVIRAFCGNPGQIDPAQCPF
jgi:hypothetical protein